MDAGAELPYSQATPVSVSLPADPMRVLPDPGVSVAECHDETSGDQVLGPDPNGRELIESRLDSGRLC